MAVATEMTSLICVLLAGFQFTASNLIVAASPASFAVRKGSFILREEYLTGESLPVWKKPTRLCRVIVQPLTCQASRETIILREIFVHYMEIIIGKYLFIIERFCLIYFKSIAQLVISINNKFHKIRSSVERLKKR